MDIFSETAELDCARIMYIMSKRTFSQPFIFVNISFSWFTVNHDNQTLFIIPCFLPLIHVAFSQNLLEMKQPNLAKGNL